MLVFKNRKDAGTQLAAALKQYKDKTNTIVLGLPRGGIPVAFEIAKALNLPLDVFLVRKLGAPYQEELAMGAIAQGDIRIFNEDVIQGLGISDTEIELEIGKEQAELERRNFLYRGDKPPIDLTNKTVILVDDGVATGATIKAAIQAIEQAGCQKLIVAVPLAPIITTHTLKTMVDEVICLQTPEPFYAIGNYYQDFTQVSSNEVCRLLAN